MSVEVEFNEDDSGEDATVELSPGDRVKIDGSSFFVDEIEESQTDARIWFEKEGHY